MRRRVGVIGGGVVGSAIAYHLSQNPQYEIHVWDQRSPDAFGATGAALGVLMAAISPKLKGKHVRLRLESLKLYDAWVESLEHALGISLPYNREGIVQLMFDAEQFARWDKTVATRAKQGFTLEQWPRDRVIESFPRVERASLLETGEPLVGAIYSPNDRQLNPIAFTQACRQAAQQQGAQLHWQTQIYEIAHAHGQVHTVSSSQATWPVDVLVISAGLGSMPLTRSLQQPLSIQPVLGQALKLQLEHSWTMPSPVINGGSVHLVPLNATELWVGASVEFPAEATPFQPPEPDPRQLDQVLKQAIALCPELVDASIVDAWTGLRPRPMGQAAPILEVLPGYVNAIAATGHYRNGVLLAPITAHRVGEHLSQMTSIA